MLPVKGRGSVAAGLQLDCSALSLHRHNPLSSVVARYKIINQI